MEFFVGQTLCIPALPDICEAHTATITEIHEDLLCVITEDGEYGELDLELIHELHSVGVDVASA